MPRVNCEPRLRMLMTHVQPQCDVMKFCKTNSRLECLTLCFIRRLLLLLMGMFPNILYYLIDLVIRSFESCFVHVYYGFFIMDCIRCIDVYS